MRADLSEAKEVVGETVGDHRTKPHKHDDKRGLGIRRRNAGSHRLFFFWKKNVKKFFCKKKTSEMN